MRSNLPSDFIRRTGCLGTSSAAGGVGAGGVGSSSTGARRTGGHRPIPVFPSARSLATTLRTERVRAERLRSERERTESKHAEDGSRAEDFARRWQPIQALSLSVGTRAARVDSTRSTLARKLQQADQVNGAGPVVALDGARAADGAFERLITFTRQLAALGSLVPSLAELRSLGRSVSGAVSGSVSRAWGQHALPTHVDPERVIRSPQQSPTAALAARSLTTEALSVEGLSFAVTLGALAALFFV